MPVPRKTPVLTTAVAMPECSGRFTSLAIVHESVNPGISRPIAKNQPSVAANGHRACASHGSHDSA